MNQDLNGNLRNSNCNGPGTSNSMTSFSPPPGLSGPRGATEFNTNVDPATERTKVFWVSFDGKKSGTQNITWHLYPIPHGFRAGEAYTFEETLHIQFITIKFLFC